MSRGTAKSKHKFLPAKELNVIPVKKGLFIWNISRCAGGRVERIVEEARNLGLSHVSIKVQNGASHYNFENQQGRLVDLMPALRSAGIAVFGWGYVYGNKWYSTDGAKREAAITLEAIERWRLDGFHIDAEAEYKNQAGAANVYANALTAARPGYSFGLTSYRYPSLHPELPWAQLLRICDHHYPQVYWEQAHNPAVQLARSVGELQALKNIPVVPAGSAYPRGNWVPTERDIGEFMTMAKNGGLPGCSFWSWEHAEKLQKIWERIAYFEWGGGAVPPSALTLEERVARIERVLNIGGEGIGGNGA